MYKLRDIFYDKNDILVAIIILVIAAAVILWRVDAIMAYPATLVSEKTASETPGNSDSPGSTTTPGIASEGGEATNGEDPGNEVTVCAIYVNYGESLNVIAQNCVSAGLIGSSEEFMNAVNAAGAAGSIQAGQHHIPSNVTPEELIQYLTKPGL